MNERYLWSTYAKLQKEHPKSDSQAKVDFYNQNSEFIKRNININNPDISIIIPAHNESALIPRTLAGINSALQEFSGKADLIIVNNASTDDTKSIAEFFGARVIDEKTKGIGRARQTGLENSNKSKFILTTDADTIVPNKWITDHFNSLNSSDAIFTYGRINYVSDLNLKFPEKIPFCLYIEISKLIHNLKEKQGQIVTGASNNGFNKELAIIVGGYNSSLALGEDYDLMNKMAEYGKINKVNSTVLTSARRVFGEGIINRSVTRLKANLSGSNKNQDYSGIKCEDYRDVK